MDSQEPEPLVPLAVNTLPINMAILDCEGTILHTNRAWQEFGEANDITVQPDSIGSNYLEITSSAGTKHAQTAAAGLCDVLTGERELFEFEYPCHSPNKRRWFLMRAAPFIAGDQRYAVVAHFEITERYEYQRRVQASNERLQQFAYAVSHDLQEPLRMVTRYLELIEQRYADDLDEDATEFIEFAVDGAERMSEMIDGLLDYARVHTHDDQFTSVDLDAVLDDTLSDLSVAIEETDAEITAEELPSVSGDGNQLRQVFQNLLENAITYSGDEPPRIHITAERDGSEWVITVRDEGIGIAPEHTDRIFGVFSRLHTQDEHAGTGIGLALCKRIIEHHDGEIWVESEPGEGSAFFVSLPASRGLSE